MNAERFYKQLAGMAEWGWRGRVNKDRVIELTLGTTAVIRFSPIVAIYMEMTNGCGDARSDLTAGNYLGMPPSLIERIRKATLNQTSHGRAKILQVLKIKPG